MVKKAPCTMATKMMKYLEINVQNMYEETLLKDLKV